MKPICMTNISVVSFATKIKKSYDIVWPQVIIKNRLDQTFPGNSLSVVHVTLGGIIAEQAVDHDFLFCISEPTSLSTSTTLGLAWRSRHHNPGSKTNNASDETFDEEKPLPARPPVNTSHLQNTSCDKGSNTGRLVSQ